MTPYQTYQELVRRGAFGLIASHSNPMQIPEDDFVVIYDLMDVTETPIYCDTKQPHSFSTVMAALVANYAKPMFRVVYVKKTYPHRDNITVLVLTKVNHIDGLRLISTTSRYSGAWRIWSCLGGFARATNAMSPGAWIINIKMKSERTYDIDSI